jgi:hypothetical protein
MADDKKEDLTEQMNNLAAEFAGLRENDPCRAELAKELSQLSLLSASAKGRGACVMSIWGNIGLLIGELSGMPRTINAV